MNNYLQKFTKITGQTVMGIVAWRLFAALFSFIIIVLLSGKLSSIITGILKKLMVKIDDESKDKFSKSLEPCFRMFFSIMAIWTAFYILGLENVFVFINHIVRLLLIFAASWALYRSIDIISYYFRKLVSKTETDLDDYIVGFLGRVLKFLVIALGFIILLQELGYNATSIIAGLGVGGLAIALAGKDFAANIFGFLTIFLDRSLSVGDWISTPDVEGTVEDLGMRSAKIRTLSDSLITIPNSVLAGKKIDNCSKRGKRRLSFKVGVSYSSTTGQLKELCKKTEEILKENPNINKDTAAVYLSDLGESSINISLSCYTIDADFSRYLQTQHQLILDIMEAVEKLGLSLAFPSRSIYFENLDSQAIKLMDEMKEKKVSK